MEPTQTPVPSLDSAGLREAVDTAAIRTHLQELQRIAEAHGGNRAAGTIGFDASVEYVAARLEAAGYAVERQPFSFPLNGDEEVSVNLVAELPGRSASEVVMLGAHLDSVPGRAGINDNGSGSMMLLTLAERLPEFEQPDRTVRFAFWGAEEPGLYGSTAYVEGLDAAEREQLMAYLNFDMIGSPNHVRFIYDDREAAAGSEAITRLFSDYFDSAGLAWDTFDLSGKTDHAPFSRTGIPTGGLFSGGIELKTDAQAAAIGGTAGAPADPCNDRICDTTANVNDAALDEMADAAAHALATLVGE
ncbi:MAG: M20/M25/M40 family metallo-hydrolase [Candidatus Limnocylindria bacterium]